MEPALGIWSDAAFPRREVLLDAFASYAPHLIDFARREKIPEKALPRLMGAALGLAEILRSEYTSAEKTLIAGIQGAQGSGKTTLSSLVADVLIKVHDCPSCLLSLDDFYLTHAQRQDLARDLHPLFATRGVPGTHDLTLLNNTLDRLLNAQPSALTPIPRFDKAQDDRVAAGDGLGFRGRPALILLEGWCITPPEPRARLVEPTNALEALEDAEGHWRRSVNLQLEGPYAALYRRLDTLVMLRIPGFASVSAWRSLQESKLTLAPEARRMNAPDLARFIQHFERLTRWSLETLPLMANLVFEVDQHHEIVSVRQNPDH